MGKRRLRGLIIVGVLIWLLGLATLWFIGGWPDLSSTGNGPPPLDPRPNPFGTIALVIATMGCCGLVLVLIGIVGLLLSLSHTRD